MRFVRYLLIVCATVFASKLQATTIDPIDLNGFYNSNATSVIVDPDSNGSTNSAKLMEDQTQFVVFLSNDPSLGDPNLIVAAPGSFLKFDYDFAEGGCDPLGNCNDDIFNVYLFDTSDPGNPLSGFQLTLDTSGAGSVAWDLSGLTSNTLGMQIELTADFTDALFDSVATISNVVIQKRDPGVVSEPPLVLLFGTAMLIAGWVRRRAS